MQAFPSQNTNQNDFKLPLSINDFTIIENLSNGEQSSVFKAKYNKNNRTYILKAKNQDQFQDQGKEIDYMREKEILYDLTKRNCPFSAKLFTDFQDDNYRYLVMEFCEGTNLKKLRGKEDTNGYVEQKLVIYILNQLLEILKYLHDTCNIIHRNIKPDKIILGIDNNIKLLGFGIAAYLIHPNKILVSNKSFKGQIRYAPPEIILYPPPLSYDYKIDIFALGFTIYSLMNPSQGTKTNLPQETEGTKGKIKRYENKKINKFYDSWLNDFVKLLYENDQQKRPTAAAALGLFNQLQNNPNAIAFYNQMASNQNLNIIPNNIQNNNHNEVAQNQPFVENQNVIPGQEDIYISSMKSILYILYKLDIVNYIKSQLNQLFNNCQMNYQQLFMLSFCQMMNLLMQLENNQIDINNYNQAINNFMQQILNNNSDNNNLSQPRPIMIFYMISSIFKKEIQQYFNNCYQNNIFDNIIQNNFGDFNCIIPINNPNVYNSVSQKILTFKNQYKSPFVDNFYFLILSISKCPQCGNPFGIHDYHIAQFLQLDVPNPNNTINELINNYFNPNNEIGNYYCQNCSCQGKKMIVKYCLNAPNYLVMEFEDKNRINFSDKIGFTLYNGQNCCYQYYASIYKHKVNNGKSYCAIIKMGNAYYLYSNDSVNQCSEQNINSDCPSLAIYKRIS